MQTISPKLYPLLTSIIDESYTDGIDRISSARENDDGTILVVGVDGTKQIAAKISDGNIKIRLLNPDAVSTKSAAFSSANIYEQLGMRLLELVLEAEFASPKKNNGALKKKTCKTGLSCGGSCISKTKICARALSIEQQKQFKELKKRLKGGDLDAVEGIQDLKDKQQGSKSQPSAKPDAKVETKPTAESKKMTAKQAIDAIQGTDMRNMDKQSAIKTIQSLDLTKESHASYAAASVETAKFFKKNADGLVVDTDTGGTTSSFDRASELLRISNRKELSDDDVEEAGDFLRQGLRGHAGSAVNKANVLLAQDIWNRLNESQKGIFAQTIPESYVETSFDKQLVDNPFIQTLLKRRGEGDKAAF